MIQGYFGLPGSGKTTYLTMIAQRELRRIRKGKSKYKRVLTNFYCGGCDRLDPLQLSSERPCDSLVLIDEITLLFDSRDFKKFNLYKDFFIYHRHANNDIIYFCQQWDGVDKKIRDMTVCLFRVKRIGPFSCATLIYRIFEIDKDRHEVVFGYRFPTLFEKLFPFIKTIYWCFRPLYYKYFDSYELPDNWNEMSYLSWDQENQV